MSESSEVKLAGASAATAARQARAAVKRELLFSGESFRAAVALAHSDQPSAAAVARMRVAELLSAMPGMGPRRAEEMLITAGVATTRRIGGLGTGQVATLAAIIDERAARRALRARA